MLVRQLSCFSLIALLASHGGAQVEISGETVNIDRSTAPADQILSSIDSTALRSLLVEVMSRSPGIAAAGAQAAAADHRASQVRALPDPVGFLTAFPLPPQTRVGPQEFSLGVAQTIPWAGKRKLRGQAEVFNAKSAQAAVEALRLRLLTQARHLLYELAFLDAFRQVLQADRATLLHYEQLADARYRSGRGLQQAIVKIQAEVSRANARLLEVADRRAAVVAALNALRDRPQETTIAHAEQADYPEIIMDRKTLRLHAMALRPEITEADALIERSATLINLAEKEYKPDFTAGLKYTVVGRREDLLDTVSAPPDDGDDILAISVGINLPVWREKLRAAVEETTQSELAAKESRRSVITGIDQVLGELCERLTLTWSQLRLFEDVLVAQAEQSLLSAEAGYSAGTHDALDLLDAERVLLEVRTGIERNRADYAIAIARLEGAVGAPHVSWTLSRGSDP